MYSSHFYSLLLAHNNVARDDSATMGQSYEKEIKLNVTNIGEQQLTIGCEG